MRLVRFMWFCPVLCILIEHCPVSFVFSWFSRIGICSVVCVVLMCWLCSMSMYCWPLYVCMFSVVPSVVAFMVVFSVAILYCPGWHCQLAVVFCWAFIVIGSVGVVGCPGLNSL